MWVSGPFSHAVVLAVYRHPFLGAHAGGQPQPKSHDVAHASIQHYAPVGLAAMEIKGHADQREVGHC